MSVFLLRMQQQGGKLQRDVNIGTFALLTFLLLAASETLSYTRRTDLCLFTRLISALVLFLERALHRPRNRLFDDCPRGLRPVKPSFLPHVLSGGTSSSDVLSQTARRRCMPDMHVVARCPGMLMIDPLQSLYPSLVSFSASRHNAHDAALCVRNVPEYCLADTMLSRDCDESLFRCILCFCRIFSTVTHVFGA